VTTGPATIVLLTLVVLVVACAGLYQLYQGALQKRAMIEQSMGDDVERRARRLRRRLDVRLRRTRRGNRLALRLQGAGLELTALDFLALAALAAVAGYFLARIVLPPLFSLFASAAAVGGCFSWLRYKQNERREVFIGQLPELARVLSNAASAGLALRTAIPMAADELTDPAKAELQKTSEAMAVGQSLEDALRELEQRMPSRELAVLVTTLVIQARSGGALVSALRSISETLEARKELRREVKTVMAGAVFTSYIVVLMGVGTLLFLNTFDDQVLDEMLTTPLGLVATIVAAGLYLVGFTVIRRMTRIDV
jgi:tight adherence protein B